ncbi:sulfurtransferase TusA family protein [Phaeospirillum tilakii]|uniref:Sulfurtransferase TusA family protein n=1 Tax=Phaeospirillum tilakii TaxID=741673 RepID=A0ABW5CFN5_9PROT
MSRIVVDVSGLHCPLPVLHTRKAVRGLPPGSELEVRATDPASVRDISLYCRNNDIELLTQREEDGVYIFELRTGG